MIGRPYGPLNRLSRRQRRREISDLMAKSDAMKAQLVEIDAEVLANRQHTSGLVSKTLTEIEEYVDSLAKVYDLDDNRTTEGLNNPKIHDLLVAVEWHGVKTVGEAEEELLQEVARRSVGKTDVALLLTSTDHTALALYGRMPEDLLELHGDALAEAAFKTLALEDFASTLVKDPRWATMRDRWIRLGWRGTTEETFNDTYIRAVVERVVMIHDAKGEDVVHAGLIISDTVIDEQLKKARPEARAKMIDAFQKRLEREYEALPKGSVRSLGYGAVLGSPRGAVEAAALQAAADPKSAEIEVTLEADDVKRLDTIADRWDTTRNGAMERLLHEAVAVDAKRVDALKVIELSEAWDAGVGARRADNETEAIEGVPSVKPTDPKEGRYRARAVAPGPSTEPHEYGKTKSGIPEMLVHLFLPEVGRTYIVQLFFSRESFPYAEARLRALGCTNIETLAGIDSNEVDVELKYEWHVGKWRTRVHILTENWSKSSLIDIGKLPNDVVVGPKSNDPDLVSDGDWWNDSIPYSDHELMRRGRFLWEASYAQGMTDEEVRKNVVRSDAGFPAELVHFSAKWAVHAFQRLMTSHTFAAALMCSDVQREVLVGIEKQWDAFLVIVPNGMLIADRFEFTRVMIAVYDFGARMLLVTSDPMSRHRRSPVGLVDEAPTLADLLVSEEADLAAETPASRCFVLAKRLVAGLLPNLQHEPNVKVRKVEARPKSKGREAEPEHRIVTIGHPVEIDCRVAIKEYVEHGRAGRKHGPPTVQVMVRGHYRMQVCGVGRMERKKIWIQPHWRGPEAALIQTRAKVTS